jgi:hypothetical protein
MKSPYISLWGLINVIVNFSAPKIFILDFDYKNNTNKFRLWRLSGTVYVYVFHIGLKNLYYSLILVYLMSRHGIYQELKIGLRSTKEYR